MNFYIKKLNSIFSIRLTVGLANIEFIFHLHGKLFKSKYVSENTGKPSICASFELFTDSQHEYNFVQRHLTISIL